MPRNQPPRIPARPFGMPGTPFDPKTGKFFPLSDSRVVEQFIIEEVADNVLLCRDSHGKYTVVAKPWQFRRQEYDGLTLDGITYTWTALDTRDADDGDDVEVQYVGPVYVVGEYILAAKRPTRVRVDLPDDQKYAAEWEDINTAGRDWSADVAFDNLEVQRMRVKTSYNDYLMCHTWNGSVEGSDPIYVAKPWKLRHLLANYNLVTAVLVTIDESTIDVSNAVVTERWVVTPPYELDDEIMAVSGHEGGTGVSHLGIPIVWFDMNENARAWGEKCL
jgi:hypothetical protein